jgi:hypothetical protein
LSYKDNESFAELIIFLKRVDTSSVPSGHRLSLSGRSPLQDGVGPEAKAPGLVFPAIYLWGSFALSEREALRARDHQSPQKSLPPLLEIKKWSGFAKL